MKRFALGLMTGLALVVSGCADGDLTTMDDRNEKIEPGDVEEGDVPVGKQITLTGDVKKVYDERTFALSDEGIDFEEDLIVVTKEPLPFTADEDGQLNTIMLSLGATPTAVLRLFDRFALFAALDVVLAVLRLAAVALAWASGAGLWTFLLKSPAAQIGVPVGAA